MKTFTFITERISNDSLSIQDGGQAKILTVDTDEDCFFRIQSWDEEKNHCQLNELFSNFNGKKMKITIEEIEEKKNEHHL